MKSFPIQFALILMAGFFLTSCDKDKICISGNGPDVTRTLNISDFNRIDLQGAADVFITQGSSLEVKATGPSNIIDQLETKVSGNTWDIDFEKGCYTDYDLVIEITMPDLKEIILSGAGDIWVDNFTGQSDLDLRISGSGNIDLGTFDGTQNLTMKISGSGNIYASEAFSELKNMDIKISGSGNVNSFPIQSKNCDINISGSGNCEVTVESKLDVKITGSGNVYYKGQPSINSNINAAGHIYDAN